MNNPVTVKGFLSYRTIINKTAITVAIVWFLKIYILLLS